MPSSPRSRTRRNPAGDGPGAPPLPPIGAPRGDAIAVPPGAFAAVEVLEARATAELRPQTVVAAALVRRFAILSTRLDTLSVHDAAMTARRVRYARVNRENERWAEAVAVARTLDYDPTTAVRKLRQTPEGMDWLIREWDLLEAEVAAGLDPLPEARTVYERAQLFLGLHNVEQDGGEWAVHCKALELPSFQTEPEEDRAHRDWVAAWAAGHARALREERARLDHAAEEEDRNEATTRALFDPGPDAERARRYEAASDRSLLRTIRELDRTLAREPEPDPTPRPTRPPAEAPTPPAPAVGTATIAPAPAPR